MLARMIELLLFLLTLSLPGGLFTMVTLGSKQFGVF